MLINGGKGTKRQIVDAIKKKFPEGISNYGHWVCSTVLSPMKLGGKYIDNDGKGNWRLTLKGEEAIEKYKDKAAEFSKVFRAEYREYQKLLN